MLDRRAQNAFQGEVIGVEKAIRGLSACRPNRGGALQFCVHFLLTSREGM